MAAAGNRRRRLLLAGGALALLLVLGAVAAASAQAAGTVTVVVTGQGSATGDGIDCTQSGGPVCSLPYADDQDCDPERKPPCFNIPPTVTFTAGADSNGFVFDHWSDCDGVVDRDCQLTVTGNSTVTAHFVDGQNPSVGSLTPTGGAQRGTINLGATASDNAGVSRVDFSVRGVVVASDSSAPYQATFNTAAVSDGGAQVQAIAVDTSNRTSAVTSSITIDNTAPTLNVTSGPDGDVFGDGSTQTWSFTAGDSPAGLSSVQCKLEAPGSPASFGACSGGSSSHLVSGLAPGTYVFSVRARDAAGNETVLTRSFSVVQSSGGESTGGTGDAGAGGTGGTGTPAGPTDEEIATLLSSDLAAAGRTLGRQRLARLAQRGSVGLRFRALVAGRFVLAFKGTATRQKAARSIVIASGSRSVTAAGTYTVKLKLTRAGKRLLRSGRRVRGKLSAGFAKTGGGSLTRTRAVTLTRG